MKKKLILMIGLWVAVIATIWAAPVDGDVVDVLAGWGLSKGLATIIVTLLAFVIGHFAVPQKWASISAIIQKVLESLIVMLNWFNEKTNKLSNMQKDDMKIEVAERKANGVKKIIYVFVLGLFLSSLSLSGYSQGKFNGMLKPVTSDKIVLLKADDGTASVKTGVFLPRYTASIAATVFKYNTETKKIESNPMARVGAGLSWAHYSLVNDEPFNDYSFNGLILFPTDGTTNIGAALTISALNFHGMSINAGVMYDFVKGQPFKQNYGFLNGVTLVF